MSFGAGNRAHYSAIGFTGSQLARNVLWCITLAGAMLAAWTGMSEAAAEYRVELFRRGPSIGDLTVATDTKATPPALITGSRSENAGTSSFHLYGYTAMSDQHVIELTASGAGYSLYGVGAEWWESAQWRWDDVVFTCADGRTQVSAALRINVKGYASGFSFTYDIVPQGQVALYLGHPQYFYTQGVWMAGSSNYAGQNSCLTSPPYTCSPTVPGPPSSGVFAGSTGDVLDQTITFLMGEPPSPLVPTGTPVLVAPAFTLVLTHANEYVAGVFSPSAGGGISLPTDGPVFDLPEGCTCNSPQMGVVNNRLPGAVVPITVSGTVVSDCDGPLNGIQVTLVDGSGTPSNTMTSEDGTFAFTDVPSSDDPGQISIGVPGSYEPVSPPTSQAAVSLAADAVVDFGVGCTYVTVSGAVTAACSPASCAAAVEVPEGLTVTLVDGDGTSHTTTTGAGGAYGFEAVRYSENPGQVSIQVPSGFQLVTSPTIQGSGQSIALTDDVVADFGLECVLVQVTGTVSACDGALGNVTVDLLDGRGGFCTTTTSANGAYAFPGIPHSAVADGGEVSVSIPLGYEAVSPGVAGAALTLDGDRVQDFVLGCLDPAGNPLGMGYWKHQANVHLTGRGHAQESYANMATNFPTAIYQHFYENTLNGIHVLAVTYIMSEAGPQPIDLATIANTLTVSKGGTTLARAKQQYLTLLLNAASGKLLTSATVSADGATCSQALQHVAAFINDGNASNDQLAHDIASAINDAQIVPAGMIDLDIENILYKAGVNAQLTQSLGVGPSPGRGSTTVRFHLAQSEPVSVRVYAVNGRLVRELRSGTLAMGTHALVWDGRDQAGQTSPAGVYYVQLQLGEKRAVHRFVMLR